jgi:hypothetical protein
MTPNLFNLPQGFLGEVGEVYEPGGGVAGRPGLAEASSLSIQGAH